MGTIRTAKAQHAHTLLTNRRAADSSPTGGFHVRDHQGFLGPLKSCSSSFSGSMFAVILQRRSSHSILPQKRHLFIESYRDTIVAGRKRGRLRAWSEITGRVERKSSGFSRGCQDKDYGGAPFRLTSIYAPIWTTGCPLARRIL